jgi:hypothetical protein
VIAYQPDYVRKELGFAVSQGIEKYEL